MTDHQKELDRIKHEYQRRASELPEDYYSLARVDNRYRHDQRYKDFEQMIQTSGASMESSSKVLEVGYGMGQWLEDLQRLGVSQESLSGIELDEERAQESMKRFPKADLRIGDAANLSWEDETFDFVLQSTVFTSILDRPFKEKVACEMLRVLKKKGFIIWYDFFFDNPKNPNVKGVSKSEIEKLFPNCQVSLKRVTLAPPISRRLAKLSTGLCSALESLKIFNTHYLALIQKSGESLGE